MRPLTLHPASLCASVTSLHARAARSDRTKLVLDYLLIGEIDDLRLPSPAASARTDELWRRTCFEAFVRGPAGAAYLEFNVSPSTQWAAYRLAGYREELSPAAIDPPRVEFRHDHRRLQLTATLDLGNVADLPADGAWRMGLSAVIEDKNRGLSYWSLAHPPGKADFHHPDCFTLELVAPDRP
jgi:hypothetical protein